MKRGPDDLKAEAIRRLRPDVNFIITNGETIHFPDNDAKAIPTAKLEMMMEEVQKEWDLNPQVDRPPLDKMLEWLWTDIHNNSLNKGGAFYKCCYPHYINKTGA